MTEGFVLMQALSVWEIKLTDDEDALNKFGKLRAAVCPQCGEVSLYSENEDLVEEESEEEGEYTLCSSCGYPVYEDEKSCAHCGKKKGGFFIKKFKRKK